MIAVDASVLIAYLDSRDAHHHAAVALLAAATPPLLVHPVTAAEVLVAPTRCGLAEPVWADLTAIGVEVDTTTIDPMLLARLRVSSGCKMPDCCVLAVAITHGALIATFDERLAKHLPEC